MHSLRGWDIALTSPYMTWVLVQFSPSTPLPIGVTDPPTNLNSPQGSVDLNGHIVTDGRDVPYYFNWGTDPTLATSTSTPQQTLTPDAGPGSYI